MPTIVIASENPIKQNATPRGFQSMFRETEWTMESENVPSGDSDQPRSDQETLQSATNRAHFAARGYPLTQITESA